ncbi:MAG TPA: hypothetical protein VIK75_00780, partial [Calditerricola sp.]
VRCCWRVDLDQWLKDVGGTLELDDVWWPKVPLPALPPLVPVLAGPMRRLPRWPAWGVRWDRVLSRSGQSVQQRWLRGDPQGVLGVPSEVAVVATLIGPDPVIEGLWTAQWGERLWERLAGARFSLVIGPNYSVYGNHPRFEHRLNLKRSLLAALRMRMFGVPAVPSVYVWRMEDVDALARWAHAVELDALAVNFQTFYNHREWGRVLPLLLALRDAVPEGVRWFFPGVSSRERMEVLQGLFPGAVFLTLRPYECATHGRRVRGDGTDERKLALPEDLLEENLRAMAQWIERS